MHSPEGDECDVIHGTGDSWLPRASQEVQGCSFREAAVICQSEEGNKEITRSIWKGPSLAPGMG